MAHRRLSVRLIVAVLALLLASCAPFQPSTSQSGQPPAGSDASPPVAQAGRQLADAVDAESLRQTLTRIEQLTVAADGNRGPGSRGYQATAEWIEAELEETGFYRVHRQDFTIQTDHPGDSFMVDGDGRVINQRPLRFSAGTDGVSGAVVVPARGDGCRASDWEAPLGGQIALAERGGCTFTQLNAAAAEAGAAMVVVSNNVSAGLYGTLDRHRADAIPMTGITRAAGNQLGGRLADGEVRLSYFFDQHINEYRTFNLFAETTGGQTDNVVMAGAHLDGVPEGPGVNDNGSGSAVLLETALRLAEVGQPANKVRFAWWSGEELGLLGSIHWVNGLVESDPQAIASLAAYINVDMVASPNHVIGVYDGDGSSFDETDLPQGSAELERRFTDYFDSIGQPWVDAEIGLSSDHYAFLSSGVPIGGLFTGAGGTKTADEEALFGGQAGRNHDPNYHQESDTLTNANLAALAINGKAVAYVIGALAADTTMVNGARPGNQGTPTPAEEWGYAAAF